MRYQVRFCRLKRREQKPEIWKVNPPKVLSSEAEKGQPERWKEIPKRDVSGKYNEGSFL